MFVVCSCFRSFSDPGNFANDAGTSWSSKRWTGADSTICGFPGPEACTLVEKLEGRFWAYSYAPIDLDFRCFFQLGRLGCPGTYTGIGGVMLNDVWMFADEDVWLAVEETFIGSFTTGLVYGRPCGSFSFCS